MLANLKAALAERGMKQKQLAARCRLPAPTLSRIVTGRVSANAKTRARIARVLRCDESWLFERVTIPVGEGLPHKARKASGEARG